MDIYQIYQNRVNTMRTLIEQDRFSLDIFCRYYGIPKANARVMYRNNFVDMPKKIEEVESENPISLDKLVNVRNSYLAQYPNDRENALNDLGFWCEPYDVYSFTDSDYARQIAKNFFSATAQDMDAYKNYKQTKEVSSYLLYLVDNRKDDLVKVYASVESPYLSDKEMLCKLLAIPQPGLAIIRDIIIAEYPELHQTQHDKVVETRRQLVWEMYNCKGSSHGYTQQEIADELGITRATVHADLKAYQESHPECKDATQLYAVRHSGIEEYTRRQHRSDKTIELYEQGYNQQQISQKLKISPSLVKLFLMEQGKIGSINDINKVELKHTYKYKKMPNQYKKNRQGVKYFHKSSTAHILDEINAPAPSVNMFDRNKARYPKLAKQKEYMAIIRNNPELIPLLEKYNGSITKAKKALKEQSITNEELAI